MRKELRIWIMAILLLIGQLSSANATVNISGSPATKLTEKNTNFSVNITFDPDRAITAAQHDLRFNSSVLAVQNVLEGDLFNQSGLISTVFSPGILNNSNGSLVDIWVFIVPGANVTTKGNMSNITMIATQNGTFALNLTYVIIADPDSNPVENNISSIYEPENGSVTIGYVCVSPNYNINCLGHKTDIVDLTILNQNWGRSGIAACPQYEGRCKNIVVDACDCVNTADKLKLQQNYGKTIVLG